MASPIALTYERFALLEAHGESPLYEEWALGIARDGALLARLDGLPEAKRQPNLLFAAARTAGAQLDPYPVFRPWLLSNWDAVRRIVLERFTQTNEPARSIALVAALDGIEEPVALLEVGASAGLCLYPDRLRYHLRTADGAVVLGPDSGVVVDCSWSGGPVPARLPEVVCEPASTCIRSTSPSPRTRRGRRPSCGRSSSSVGTGYEPRSHSSDMIRRS